MDNTKSANFIDKATKILPLLTKYVSLGGERSCDEVINTFKFFIPDGYRVDSCIDLEEQTNESTLTSKTSSKKSEFNAAASLKVTSVRVSYIPVTSTPS